MKTTTDTKSRAKGTLPKRNPKTGRFEKATAKVATTAKPAVKKTKKA